MEDGNKYYFAEDGEKKIDYFLSLNLKQYQMYNLCESKVNIIATISAIFIGAAIIFIDKAINQESILGIYKSFLIIGIILMLFFFITSLTIMILYVGPDKWINPKWVGIKDSEFLPNHRAVYGIKEFKNKNEYKEYILTLTQEQTVDQIINQIFVLNKMIWKMQKVINMAGLFNILGLVMFLLLIGFYFYGNA